MRAALAQKEKNHENLPLGTPDGCRRQRDYALAEKPSGFLKCYTNIERKAGYEDRQCHIWIFRSQLVGSSLRAILRTKEVVSDTVDAPEQEVTRPSSGQRHLYYSSAPAS
jgi:hypothetical protein